MICKLLWEVPTWSRPRVTVSKRTAQHCSNACVQGIELTLLMSSLIKVVGSLSCSLDRCRVECLILLVKYLCSAVVRLPRTRPTTTNSRLVPFCVGRKSRVSFAPRPVLTFPFADASLSRRDARPRDRASLRGARTCVVCLVVCTRVCVGWTCPLVGGTAEVKSQPPQRCSRDRQGYALRSRAGCFW